MDVLGSFPHSHLFSLLDVVIKERFLVHYPGLQNRLWDLRTYCKLPLRDMIFDHNVGQNSVLRLVLLSAGEIETICSILKITCGISHMQERENFSLGVSSHVVIPDQKKIIFIFFNVAYKTVRSLELLLFWFFFSVTQAILCRELMKEKNHGNSGNISETLLAFPLYGMLFIN